MSLHTYTEIDAWLAAGRALTDVPEAHGTMVGALCASGEYTLDDWLREVFPEGDPGDARGALQSWFDATATELRGRELEFEPCLPDDATPVVDRAAALGQWCQGFLYGLGTSPIPDIEHLPAEIGEVVRDLTAITQVSVDESDGAEANESAYAELVEFVRVGVQLLFDEFARFREAGAAGSADGTPVALH
ncbi:MAG: UPF0149 family protein [Steroidobacteraceae bacterium]|jgi:uncharacterized protein YgfB (UPF0149 family)|nr:YecA family protein [Gammaproteobacteria bacterium]